MRHSSRRDAARAPAAESPGQTLLKGAASLHLVAARLLTFSHLRRAEGLALQHRAERSKAPPTECTLFSAAAERFRDALLHPLGEEERSEAAFGLVRTPSESRSTSHRLLTRRQGECLQRWAESHVAAARSAPLSAQLAGAEASAHAAAGQLCEQSVAAFSLVRADGGGGAQREDAAANCGHVLCAWAEHCGSDEGALALLERACASYDAAAAAAPADAPADVELLSAWADALVKRAERALSLAAAGGGGAAAAREAADGWYAAARRTYETACRGADTTAGDDLSARARLPDAAGAQHSPARRACCTTGAAACTAWPNTACSVRTRSAGHCWRRRLRGCAPLPSSVLPTRRRSTHWVRPPPPRSRARLDARLTRARRGASLARGAGCSRGGGRGGIGAVAPSVRGGLPARAAAVARRHGRAVRRGRGEAGDGASRRSGG